VLYLKQAKRAGAYIIVVDPTRNFSSEEIDLPVPVMPGADLPLALGLINLWREGGKLDTEFLDQHAQDAQVLLAAAEDWPVDRAADASGVSPDVICRFADAYADADPAVRVGCGTEP